MIQARRGPRYLANMPDPNAARRGPSRTGGIEPTNHSAELATIISVDAARYAYNVRTHRGRSLPGLPRKRYSPADITILPVGTTVVVRFDLGLPYIDGVLDLPASPSTEQGVPVSEVGGIGGQGFNQTTDVNRGNYRGPSEPTDMLPGDTLMANSTGARVGALEGGVALLSAAQLAQVRAHVLNDLVEIISRNYRHVTDMGIFEVKNTDGRINMSFRGASDQTNEAGADEENWTCRMDLGSEGDMFNFELTTPQGQTLFRLHVDSNGRCEIFGLDGVVTQSGNRNGEPHIAEQGGDSIDTVHGARATNTGGDHLEVVEGDHRETVDGNATLLCGNDIQQAATRDLGLSAGRNAVVSVAGDKLGNTALTTSVQGGAYEVVVGQAAYPTPGYSLRTFKGDVAFRSTMGGAFKVDTPLGEINLRGRKAVINTMTPNSVILGGSALVSHVVKYEQLELFLKALLKMLDSHTHTSAAPGTPTSPPVVPFSAILSGMIKTLKSLRVGVGG
jgi:hypothetical protein